MQEKISFDGYDGLQPDTCEPNWATTYTEDSGNTMSGDGFLDPMFTKESYSLEFSDVTKEQAKNLFQKVIPTASHPTFKFHYYSWFYGKWRTDDFYVGQGSMKCKTLEENEEALSSITFNVIGVHHL